mmetsp:Transcript_8469/g.14289  ORF Transcript_8469/g.14289 Transcript_8469/m.14289 type:complete len:218 (-) Transcript_8469:1396-2049(-)
MFIATPVVHALSICAEPASLPAESFRACAGAESFGACAGGVDAIIISSAERLTAGIVLLAELSLRSVAAAREASITGFCATGASESCIPLNMSPTGATFCATDFSGLASCMLSKRSAGAASGAQASIKALAKEESTDSCTTPGAGSGVCAAGGLSSRSSKFSTGAGTAAADAVSTIDAATLPVAAAVDESLEPRASTPSSSSSLRAFSLTDACVELS